MPRHPVRFVTAASLFDGHDAAITIIRRLLQAQGAEVVHLGHDRSVEDVATAAVQEDVDAVGLSIMSGAHNTLFPAVINALRTKGADDVVVFGGGIVPDEDIARLQAAGVKGVFTPGTSLQSIVEWVHANVHPLAT